jgi:hypothetical protein
MYIGRGHGKAEHRQCKDEHGDLTKMFRVNHFHLGAAISIAPKAVRPNRSGRYMSSIVAGGRT